MSADGYNREALHAHAFGGAYMFMDSFVCDS